MENKFGIRIPAGFSETRDVLISEMARAGFKYSFFAWKEDACASMMRLYDKNNITVDSLHAPYDGINCMWQNNSAGDDYVAYLSKCIDDASMFHIPNVVLHPVSGDAMPKSSLVGVERFKKLVDRAVSKGVKLCFENVEFSEILAVVMNEFGNDVGFCYDTGHESTNDPGVRFIPLFGDRLCCTHIHDNYGPSYMITPIYHGDCHMIPLDAAIDFKRVMRDIKSVNYKGVLMLECNRHPLLGTYSSYSVSEFYERAYAALVELASY